VSTRTRAAVHDALPSLFPHAFPGLGENALLDLSALSGEMERQVVDLVAASDFDAWSEALARVGNCPRPILLRGRSETVETTTGQIISTYSSEREPLGVTYVRCGSRRASECPSCARLYAADMFQLIRAGIAGGKTVPASVGENPLVFATFTAPSFGHVHGHRDAARRCRPHTRGPARCVHGRPRTCHERHREDDPALGQPLCRECYDYASHVVWRWWAPDLWRRFTIALRRLVAKTLGIPATRLPDVVTVQYAKVAEYQRRGLVHFHTLIRLDGPRTTDRFAAAPAQVEATVLSQLVTRAAASVRLTVPGVDTDDPGRTLALGAQLDARPVRTGRRNDDPDRAVTPEQVAGYLAKYATKSVDDTDAVDTTHHRRIRATVHALARRAAKHQQETGDGSYALLEHWSHMLGFRGHFATESRRYSVTLSALRRARRRAQTLIARHREAGRPPRPGRPRGGPPGRRGRRDHPCRGPVALCRCRLGQRSPDRPRPGSRRESPRVRPVACRAETQQTNFGREDKVMEEKLLYRIGEVAHYLSLSRSKTYELVRAGHIPSVRIDGVRRVRGADVVAYVESLRAA
jgi:excisionase family DNA binding protein